LTTRMEANQPTPIENATLKILRELDSAITLHCRGERVSGQHGTTEREFRRILALYFHDKSISDWGASLGIPDISDPADRRKLGGKS
jgi:hypothetical protein